VGWDAVSAYYNEHDPKAAAWLRELIKAELIADGDVDERSIVDVLPADVRGFTQCHFFAGIGGWSYALWLADWPDDRPVWTGSCPCQPFSQAGKGKGIHDARHLWPELRRLIAECHPAVVFGEQVASKDGRSWLAAVYADLEALAYRRAGADLCAAGVGAPHIRQRLYWVADAASDRRPARTTNTRWSSRSDDVGSVSWLEDSDRERREEQRLLLQSGRSRAAVSEVAGGSEAGRMGDSLSTGLEERVSYGSVQREAMDPHTREAAECASHPWSVCDWLPCRDGKSRPVEPGTFPLAHGVPARVGRLRGYGNALVPQVAAIFIQAYLDTIP
jgi:DNA (cytosine-5)-methyltransferase 1